MSDDSSDSSWNVVRGFTGKTTEERFAVVVEALGTKPGVSHSKPRSRLFGRAALKVHDKIFAMVSYTRHFVVKLPNARVDAIVISGVGQRLDADRDRPMKEWLEVHSESDEEWLALAREALDFVAT